MPQDITYDPVDDKIYWIESTCQQTTARQKNNEGDEGGITCIVTTNIFRSNFDGGPTECIVNDVVNVDGDAFLNGDCQSCKCPPL